MTQQEKIEAQQNKILGDKAATMYIRLWEDSSALVLQAAVRDYVDYWRSVNGFISDEWAYYLNNAFEAIQESTNINEISSCYSSVENFITDLQALWEAAHYVAIEYAKEHGTWHPF